MSDPRAVLIADDHAMARGSVRQALEDSGEFVVCAEAHDASGAIEAALREQPDVCILDINMPGNGISAAARISSQLPSAAIVMLTVSREDHDLFDALRAGASGYLLKGLDDQHLVASLRNVLAGEACLPGSLVARLIEEFRDREHRRVRALDGNLARLTPREWDVLELMRKGSTTDEIAARLFVTPSVVRTHISAILRKLQVPNRRAAVRLFQ